MSARFSPELITQVARSLIEDAGQQLTTQEISDAYVICFTASGEVLESPLAWSSNEQKFEVFEVLRDGFAHSGVIAFFLRAESWVVSEECANTEEAKKYYDSGKGSLEFAPGRKEMIIVHFVSHDEAWLMRAEILRDKDGQFQQLDEMQTLQISGEQRQNMGGAIPDLLPPRKAAA